MKPRIHREYALYKGENLLMMGKISDIARERGVKEETIRFYLSPTYARRTSENGLRLVCISGDD